MDSTEEIIFSLSSGRPGRGVRFPAATPETCFVGPYHTKQFSFFQLLREKVTRGDKARQLLLRNELFKRGKYCISFRATTSFETFFFFLIEKIPFNRGSIRRWKATYLGRPQTTVNHYLLVDIYRTRNQQISSRNEITRWFPEYRQPR